MTSQYEQPQSCFVSAGQHAWQIGVYITDNPYKQYPYRAWWEKGWKLAKRLWEEKNNRRPFVKKHRQHTR